MNKLFFFPIGILGFLIFSTNICSGGSKYQNVYLADQLLYSIKIYMSSGGIGESFYISNTPQIGELGQNADLIVKIEDDLSKADLVLNFNKTLRAQGIYFSESSFGAKSIHFQNVPYGAKTIYLAKAGERADLSISVKNSNLDIKKILAILIALEEIFPPEEEKILEKQKK